MQLNQTMNTESLRADVIVIGGGVIGCAVAYNLAKAHVNTLVIDKADNVGREASWAGAGILASHASTHDPYAELCRASLGLYPALAEALHAETQIDIEFIRSGSIAVFFTDEEKQGLMGLASRRLDRGFSAEVLTPEEVLGAGACNFQIDCRWSALPTRCTGKESQVGAGAGKRGSVVGDRISVWQFCDGVSTRRGTGGRS